MSSPNKGVIRKELSKESYPKKVTEKKELLEKLKEMRKPGKTKSGNQNSDSQKHNPPRKPPVEKWLTLPNPPPKNTCIPWDNNGFIVTFFPIAFTLSPSPFLHCKLYKWR